MPPLLAWFVVFATSASVLVLEILAGRILAPYVGVTLETYTGIIGTVLAGIALGAWYGGRVADRRDPREVLGPTIMLGGVLALASPPIIAFIGPVLASRHPVAIVTLAFAGFFSPAFVLSAVSPMVVKLQLDSLTETGRTVGRLSAVGTIGGIFGTFVTGFVLIAAFPTRPVVLALGAFLVIGGGALWFLQRPRQAEGAQSHLVVAALLLGGLTALLNSPCELESAYFCARVEVDPARDSGRLLILDTLRHSYVDLDDPTYLEFSYAQALSDVVDTFRPDGEPIDALHIGGGGFSLPRYLRATRPGTDSLVLELDPTLVQLAREELGLETGPNLRVREGDARLELSSLAADRFDLVIGDAFGGLAVPWHLTTVEFVEQIERTLRPDGVYALNLIDHPPLGFARAEAATLRRVFPHVAVMAPPERISGDSGGNFVLIASNTPLDVESIRARTSARGDDDVIAVGEDLDAFIGDAQVLTDDYAPVDQLLTTR